MINKCTVGKANCVILDNKGLYEIRNIESTNPIVLALNQFMNDLGIDTICIFGMNSLYDPTNDSEIGIIIKTRGRLTIYNFYYDPSRQIDDTIGYCKEDSINGSTNLYINISLNEIKSVPVIKSIILDMLQ
jgi:hypothetical protein